MSVTTLGVGSTAGSVDDAVVATATASGGGGGRRPATLSTSKYTIGTFVCDFGNVLQGGVRRKTFKVTNTSALPATFEVDKNVAMAAGFHIEPVKVPRLAPGDSAEFAATFKAGKRRPLGVSTVDLPFSVRNGPQSLVTLRAFVTLPDVRVTPDTVDFGDVLLEQAKVVCLQFHNVSPIAAEWEMPVVSAVGPAAKDKAYFVLEPSKGVLLPNERSIVKVVFTPSETRAYATKIPIKVTGNPKGRAVTVKGKGSVLSLSFDPPRAQIGPVLPLAAPVSMPVRLVNPTSLPIEVYSLDFDRQYADEEAVLRRSELYGTDGLLRYPPRLPSDPLPSFVVEADREAQAGGAADGEVGQLDRIGDELAAASSPRMQGEALNVVVYGPPGVGKTWQANLLLSKWGEDGGVVGATILTLDGVVQWALDGGAGPGTAAAVKDELYPPKSAAELAAEEEAAKKAAAAAAKKPKGKAVLEPVAPPPPKPRVTVATLADLLAERVRRADCARGVILDDLKCTYLEGVGDAAAAVAAAWDGQRRPGAGKLQVFAIVVDEATLAKRYDAVLSAVADTFAAATQEAKEEDDAAAAAAGTCGADTHG